MPHLTARYIEENARRPAQGQVIIRDDELTGFGLRLTQGSMSWIVECRSKGKLRRLTIGKYQLLSVDDARKEARRILAEWASNQHATPVPTLGEVVAKYISVRKLSKSALRCHQQLTKRCLGDWYDLPMTGITKDMVLTRHRELTKTTIQGSSGKTQANAAMSNLNSMFRFAIHLYEKLDGQPLIISNPVSALSHNKAWHRLDLRRVIIPDNKLSDWYKAVMSLKQKMVRDYLLVLILTGLRRTEAATLRWTDIDFNARTINVRAVNTKNRHEHCLPMSDFLIDIMERRKQDPRRSEFVFPGRDGHLVDPGHCLEHVLERSGCNFVLHDLRRTFITSAARIGVPHRLIKKLVNHIAVADVTDGYIVFQVEDMRSSMEKITEQFLTLFGWDENEWNNCVDYHRPGFLRSEAEHAVGLEHDSHI